MNDSMSERRLSRRELLRAGGLGTIGISLPQLLSSRASRAQSVVDGLTPKADACIIIFLNGGPSHLDMWDMKPSGPIEIRGEFDPIATSLDGVNVCEHLPLLARQMHHVTLVRSMNHSVNNSHAAAVYAALTGHDRGEQGGGAKPNDHPSPGAVLAKLRPTPSGSLPYITLPYKTKEGAAGPLQPGFLAGFMGATYDPFWVLDDPNAPQFHVRNLALPAGLAQERMNARRGLLDLRPGHAAEESWHLRQAGYGHDVGDRRGGLGAEPRLEGLAHHDRGITPPPTGIHEDGWAASEAG